MDFYDLEELINRSLKPLLENITAATASTLRLIITVVNPIITISIAISISTKAIAVKKSMITNFANLEISE